MKTVRFNTFNMVHKGLRTLLYDTSVQIQQNDFTDETTTGNLFERLRLVLMIFDDHAGHEDNGIFPAVIPSAPALAKELENEHHIDHALSEEILQLMDTYQQAENAQDRFWAGYKIQVAFHAFLAFNLYHLNKEETSINEVLWDNYSDEEIIAMSKALVAKIPPDKMQIYSYWMMKGLGNHEIAGWLKGVRAEAPDVVYQNLLSLAKRELPAERWAVISGELIESDAMVV